MATALPNIPDVECCICFEIFKTPKILSCGHSFCFKCLVRYIDGRKRTFPCPFCKQNVRIPRGGVNKFVTNFSLQTMTDSLRTTDSSTTRPSTSLKPKHNCPNHSKKEVEYYCQTCSLAMCSKCIYKDHKDHTKLDLECDSTRVKVVEEFSKSEEFIKKKIKDLEKIHAKLLEISEQVKSVCYEACSKIREKTEKIIGELKENCEKIQTKIRDNFDKNESQLTETRQIVMTIKTDLDTFCPTTIEEPSLTLIYSLTKLQVLQKLCKKMRTGIPPVTYVEWREGGVKVCDILGSPKLKALYPSIGGSVFKFNYTDIKSGIPPETHVELREGIYESIDGRVFRFNSKDVKYNSIWYDSEDEYASSGKEWRCLVYRDYTKTCLYLDVRLQQEDTPQVYCDIKYTLTLINKDKNKNVISKTRTTCISDIIWTGHLQIPWDKLTNPSAGFIDNRLQFRVRFDILQVRQ